MNNLVAVEHQGQRVLTTAQLAQGYETESGRISENFNRNKERYVLGKHYYMLEGEQKREFVNQTQIADGLKNAAILYLWTEKGALLHAKSLNTDKAWDVYDILVETYFNVQNKQLPQTFAEALRLAADQAEQIERLEAEKAENAPKVGFANKLLDTKDSILVRDFAKIMREEGVFDKGEKKLYAWLRENNYLMSNNMPYQQYMKYFQLQERPIDTPFGVKIRITTKITPEGQLFFHSKLLKRVDNRIIVCYD